MMIEVTIDGVKTLVDRDALHRLFAIPVTPWTPDYWNNLPENAKCVDMWGYSIAQLGTISVVINFVNDYTPEIHQIEIDPEGEVHHFCVKSDKWVSFTVSGANHV